MKTNRNNFNLIRDSYLNQINCFIAHIKYSSLQIQDKSEFQLFII
jgi:hypothetical protein